jgi:hypothetical protein
MRRQSRYLIGGAGVAMTLLSFVICLAVDMATARTRLEPAAVDRTLKGDRLLSVPRPSVAPAPQRMLEGCESSFSAIRNPQAREVVGRCLAATPIARRAVERLG